MVMGDVDRPAGPRDGTENGGWKRRPPSSALSHTMLDALSLSDALGYASMGCWLGAQFPYACILLAAVFILILLRYQPGGGKYQITVMRWSCATFSCQLALRYSQTAQIYFK